MLGILANSMMTATRTESNWLRDVPAEEKRRRDRWFWRGRRWDSRFFAI